jgi:hypothetical protein
MSAPITIVAHLAAGREEARCCLDSLAALPPQPEHEVIVVDDATAGLDDLLDNLPDQTRLLRKERREGLVACAVEAARQARGEVVVLLRGSPELDPAALAPLAATLEDPKVAAAAASLPLRPDSNPACTRALAVRRGDIAGLGQVVGAEPGFELAAICVHLASSGRRVVTASAGVAGPPRPRAAISRAPLGETPEVTIVIPTLDATAERVRTCVAAVQARTGVPHQIVLVDNGAPPQGFTAPVNGGLRAVDTPYAVVMNDDVEPQSGWWPPLREALDAGTTIAFPLTEGTWFRTDFSAWCFALSRATLEEMAHGPGEFFDPQLRVWYQDTDLLTRLRAVERPPHLVRESRIRHALSATVESEDAELRAWVEATIDEDRAAFERKHPSAADVSG